jgi:hypothetical protein
MVSEVLSDLPGAIPPTETRAGSQTHQLASVLQCPLLLLSSDLPARAEQGSMFAEVNLSQEEALSGDPSLFLLSLTTYTNDYESTAVFTWWFQTSR